MGGFQTAERAHQKSEFPLELILRYAILRGGDDGAVPADAAHHFSVVQRDYYGIVQIYDLNHALALFRNHTYDCGCHPFYLDTFSYRIFTFFEQRFRHIVSYDGSIGAAAGFHAGKVSALGNGEIHQFLHIRSGRDDISVRERAAPVLEQGVIGGHIGDFRYAPRVFLYEIEILFHHVGPESVFPPFYGFGRVVLGEGPLLDIHYVAPEGTESLVYISLECVDSAENCHYGEYSYGYAGQREEGSEPVGFEGRKSHHRTLGHQSEDGPCFFDESVHFSGVICSNLLSFSDL